MVDRGNSVVSAIDVANHQNQTFAMCSSFKQDYFVQSVRQSAYPWRLAVTFLQSPCFFTSSHFLSNYENS